MSRQNAIWLWVITSCVLLAVALFNGYPLIDADTHIYIEQAAWPHFMPDRTPFYGLFIKASSLGISLWLTVLVQCLLLSFVLIRFIRCLCALLYPRFVFELAHHVVVVLLVATFTCVAWISPVIMPTVFSAVLALSVLLFLAPGVRSRWLVIIDGLVILLALSMHFAHMVILAVVAFFVLVYGLRHRQRFFVVRSLALIGICSSFWLVMAAANRAKGHGFVFARGQHVYMMARLAESGVLGTYLSDSCPAENLPLCADRKNLPQSMASFLLSGESPFYKEGGWDSSHAYYQHILGDVFTTQPYLGMFVQKSVVATLKQFSLVQPDGDLPAYDKHSEAYKKVSAYYGHERREFITAAQQQGSLSTSVLGVFWWLTLVGSSLWFLAPGRPPLSGELRRVYMFIGVLLLVNAWTYGTFASPLPRFQYAVFWILPATNLVIISLHYLYRYKIAQTTTKSQS